MQPVQSMVGILDTSLDKINFWSTVSPIKQRAINQILDTIRFRVEATIEEDASYLKAGPPPAGGYEAEREWREWMRLTLPRTAKDVVAFIEVGELLSVWLWLLQLLLLLLLVPLSIQFYL